jgi:hypothetical protein
MKAAVFQKPHQPLTIEDVDIKDPGPGEVLVRTAASGVCHSDLHFVDDVQSVNIHRNVRPYSWNGAAPKQTRMMFCDDGAGVSCTCSRPRSGDVRA